MPSSLIISLILFLVLASLVEAGLHVYSRSVERQRQFDALAFAGELRARADRELNAVLYLSSGLRGYLKVRHDTLDEDEVMRILAAMYEHSRHIRNFGIAIGTRLSYVYPVEGNQQAVGLDYRDLPMQWPTVKRSIQERTPTLSEQLRLVQGGVGMIYRVPIYIDDRYWGLLSTVIDSESLLQAAFGDVPRDGYRFAVRESFEEHGRESALWGDAGLFRDGDVVMLTDQHGWHYAVKPPQRDVLGFLMQLARLSGWVLALALAIVAYILLRQRDLMMRQALFDPLTGLPNRILLSDRIRHALERGQRNPGQRCLLVFADLDDFKHINDEYGHPAGDTVLRTIAIRLRQCARLSDTIARWAGDEFLILVEDTESMAIEMILSRLRNCFEQPVSLDDREVTTGASIGYAISPDDGTTMEDLIRRSDERMYLDKRKRKGDADPLDGETE